MPISPFPVTYHSQLAHHASINVDGDLYIYIIDAGVELIKGLPKAKRWTWGLNFVEIRDPPTRPQNVLIRYVFEILTGGKVHQLTGS